MIYNSEESNHLASMSLLGQYNQQERTIDQTKFNQIKDIQVYINSKVFK